jgi:predicted acetyltransferase
MKSKAQKLADKYIMAERRLQSHLLSLKNGLEDCNCKNPQSIEIVCSDDYNPMVVKYCLKCGGILTP